MIISVDVLSDPTSEFQFSDAFFELLKVFICVFVGVTVRTIGRLSIGFGVSCDFVGKLSVGIAPRSTFFCLVSRKDIEMFLVESFCHVINSAYA